MLLVLLLRKILSECGNWDNLFNDLDKFVVKLEGNGARDPQSSNADSRRIAQNAMEKLCPSAYLLR